MDEKFQDLFESLPPLLPRDPYLNRHRCKICGGKCASFDVVDFNKYCDDTDPHEFGYAGIQIEYFRCARCGFLFTPFFDGWTDRDWRRFVYNDDYVKVDKEYVKDRPVHVANDFARRLKGAEPARILDYGSGAGAFAAQMRAHGFANVTCYDPFSSPARPAGLFDVITCFEVIEHSPAPMETLKEMAGFLAEGGCVLFSQTLQPDDILSRRGSWWYLAPRNGHVSMYTEETLIRMGRTFGLRFHRGDTVFGFGDPNPSPPALIGLNSIGPGFGVVRLHAPFAVPDADIVFPTPREVWWHRVDSNAGRLFRWTGHPRIAWRVKMQEISLLQMRIPYLAECRPGFAAACALSLDGVERPVTLSRGDIVAEFEVDGRQEGIIELRTPEPIADTRFEGKLGLAVRLDPEPKLAVV